MASRLLISSFLLPLLSVCFGLEDGSVKTVEQGHTSHGKVDHVGFSCSSNSRRKYTETVHPLDTTPGPGFHWAIIQSNIGKYHGASAWLNIYGLPQVGSDQYSETMIAIVSGMVGPSKDYNVIKVGWMVYPMLYGDFRTRLTVFWTTDGYQNVHCYNQQCPGFVKTSSNIDLGFILEDQGDNKFMQFNIYKDKQTGDWWFSLTIQNQEERIGYWPSSIFPTLGDHAALIQWGGSVFSPAGEPSPSMGNGHFPFEGGALIAKIRMLDGAGQQLEPRGNEIRFTDKPACYAAGKLKRDGVLGWVFGFGGPGGCVD